MMDDPASASARLPTPPAEEGDDFDAIYATIMASERGRWFLQEYAKRNRHADTQQVLAAITRIEGVIRERSGEAYQSFRGGLLEMADVIAKTRSTEIEPQAPPDGDDANSSVGAAERSPAFATAERIRDVAWSLRERGFDLATCEQIESLAAAVLSETALRDPADRRAQQLADVLGYLERRIGTMLASASVAPAAAQPEPAEEPPSLAPETTVAPPPDLPTGPPPVVRTILAVQSESMAPLSSASLLEGLNAFADPPIAQDASPSVPPPPAAAESRATPVPDIAEPAAAPAPVRERERELIAAEDTAAHDPLGALMALSDEERMALFS